MHLAGLLLVIWHHCPDVDYRLRFCQWLLNDVNSCLCTVRISASGLLSYSLQRFLAKHSQIASRSSRFTNDISRQKLTKTKLGTELNYEDEGVQWELWAFSLWETAERHSWTRPPRTCIQSHGTTCLIGMHLFQMELTQSKCSQTKHSASNIKDIRGISGFK